MAGHQNETKRHFELRDVDGDMQRAAKQAARVMPKETANRLRAERWGLAIVLVILVGLLSYLLGAF